MSDTKRQFSVTKSLHLKKWTELKCWFIRILERKVHNPLSPQTTGWSAGLQTFVCNLFYFRGGQIYPERSEDKSWSYGWQAKIRSSQGRLRSNGGKDGRHAVTRSRAGSAEEWKRGEMLYGSTAFLCLQRGKVVRISYGVCIEREAVKGLASFLSSENRIFGNDF